MKRCPTCNLTFDEEWLSFCTQDGTTLVEATTGEAPPPTIQAPPAQGDAFTADVTWVAPSAELPSSSPQWEPPPPPKPLWQPPPPPAYAQQENKSLAIAAMIVGIVGLSIGWFCLGPIPGIVAIILGLISLSQIKKYPARVGGKPMAVVGVVTGGVAVLIYAGIMIFYFVLVLLGASSR